ncbi:MAG TPA: hypothetical protein ENK59_01080 [Thioploca sp.]|nr:hypothetical protein [Thioploca sp.]
MKLKFIILATGFVLILSSCFAGMGTKEGIGTGTGVLTGAGLCSLFTKNKLLITGCGVAGGLAGNMIGARFDENDKKERQAFLAKLSDGDVGSWKNPDTKIEYSLTPVKTYTIAKTGEVCRDFRLTVNGKPELSKACKNKNSSIWTII